MPCARPNFARLLAPRCLLLWISAKVDALANATACVRLAAGHLPSLRLPSLLILPNYSAVEAATKAAVTKAAVAKAAAQAVAQAAAQAAGWARAFVASRVNSVIPDRGSAAPGPSGSAGTVAHDRWLEEMPAVGTGDESGPSAPLQSWQSVQWLHQWLPVQLVRRVVPIGETKVTMEPSLSEPSLSEPSEAVEVAAAAEEAKAAVVEAVAVEATAAAAAAEANAVVPTVVLKVAVTAAGMTPPGPASELSAVRAFGTRVDHEYSGSGPRLLGSATTLADHGMDHNADHLPSGERARGHAGIVSDHAIGGDSNRGGPSRSYSGSGNQRSPLRSQPEHVASQELLYFAAHGMCPWEDANKPLTLAEARGAAAAAAAAALEQALGAAARRAAATAAGRAVTRALRLRARAVTRALRLPQVASSVSRAAAEATAWTRGLSHACSAAWDDDGEDDEDYKDGEDDEGDDNGGSGGNGHWEDEGDADDSGVWLRGDGDEESTAAWDGAHPHGSPLLRRSGPWSRRRKRRRSLVREVPVNPSLATLANDAPSPSTVVALWLGLMRRVAGSAAGESHGGSSGDGSYADSQKNATASLYGVHASLARRLRVGLGGFGGLGRGLGGGRSVGAGSDGVGGDSSDGDRSDGEPRGRVGGVGGSGNGDGESAGIVSVGRGDTSGADAGTLGASDDLSVDLLMLEALDAALGRGLAPGGAPMDGMLSDSGGSGALVGVAVERGLCVHVVRVNGLMLGWQRCTSLELVIVQLM